ncbi:hypothetical protein R1flu_001064 [Riccia fluitans]|uniref:Superoxide dismutase copper/zinc binding domain-containing protein n=1 Tax=Riccia fluitans TaxID=41844 RepID=A0ABD1Y378_9MARC
MNGALSFSSTYFGLASFDVSRTGTRSSVVPSVGLAAHGSGPVPVQAVSQKRLKPDLTVLTPGPHSWSVNEYGDVRYGAASTGLPFSPDVLTLLNPATEDEKKAGIMGTLVADSSGHAEYTSRSSRLRVWDIIEC